MVTKCEVGICFQLISVFIFCPNRSGTDLQYLRKPNYIHSEIIIIHHQYKLGPTTSTFPTKRFKFTDAGTQNRRLLEGDS